MTDPLDNIQKRLGWINRALVVGAAFIVVALIVFVVHRMRAGSAPPAQVASAASAPAHAASGASAPKAAASTATKNAPPQASAAASTPLRTGSGAPPAAVPAAVPTASAASGPSTGAAQSVPAAPALPQAQPTTPPPSASAAAGSSATAAPARRAPAGHAHALRQPHHPVARHEPVRKHAAAASAVCSRAGWYVQVGAFAELSSYDALRARLQRFDLPNCRGPRSPHGLHVLLVGPYATRAQALHLRSHLKEPLRKASYLRHLGTR